MRRFSYVVSFVGCIMLGMFLGNFLGVNFAKAVTRWWLNYAKVDPLRPGAKELLLVSPQFWEFIAVICGLVGALYLACHLGAGQKRFFRLLDLKRVHRMTFLKSDSLALFLITFSLTFFGQLATRWLSLLFQRVLKFGHLHTLPSTGLVRFHTFQLLPPLS